MQGNQALLPSEPYQSDASHRSYRLEKTLVLTPRLILGAASPVLNLPTIISLYERIATYQHLIIVTDTPTESSLMGYLLTRILTY